jgi:hypothetical protein
MRLAGIEKGGFYPFPNYIVEAVGVAALPGSSSFQAGTRAILLDPCAGEG